MADIYGGTGNQNISDTAASDNIYAGSGDDTITITTGRDYVDGGSGEDILIIEWGTATDDIFIYANSGTYGYVNTATGYNDSSRAVDFLNIQHLRITAGSGDDYLEGRSNSWDSINGGTGVDKWDDSFSTFGSAISVNMATVSSGTGQNFADGSRIRNVEHANLSLTAHNDTFRDFGAYDDQIYGGAGDDDLGTSGGFDYLDGGSGDNTATINWSNATQAIFVYANSGSYGYVNTNTGYSDSTRKVDFLNMDHMNITAGWGDDYLEGVNNKWDSINGGAGVDRWDDSFGTCLASVSVDMSLVSSSAGQTFADGSHIRNIEAATLALTDGNDSFTDDGAYDDNIYGGSGDDTLATSDGRDYFDGGSGDNVVVMNWGNATDTVTVYAHTATYGFVNTNTNFNDSMRRVDFVNMDHMDVTAGSGDDFIEGVHSKWDSIDGGAGVDKWDDSFGSSLASVSVDMALVSSSGGQTFADGTHIRNVEVVNLGLTNGNDTFRDDGAFDDLVYGGSGNDDIGTSGGRDYVDGGGDTDTLTVDWADATQDIFFYAFTTTHAYVNTNTNFNDSTRRVDFVNMENLKFDGGSGDDYIQSFHNRVDSINGGAGTDRWIDSFSARTSSITVNMSQASSNSGQTLADGTVLRNIEAANVTLGQAGDTFSDHGAFDDNVYGGGGNDHITIYGGRDYVDGGTGTDTLRLDWGDAAHEIIIDVTAFSYAYVNTNTNYNDSTRRVDWTNVENIFVTYGASDDTFVGTAGDDTVEGRAGADTLDGAGGSDTLSYENSPSGVTVNLLTDTASGGHATGDTIANFENVIGSAHGDTLTGDGGPNRLYGGGGSDRIYGGDGDDSLWGGSGSDRVYGGAGDDYVRVGGGVESFYGGSGSDRISYYDSTGGVNVNLTTNAVSGSWASNDVISGFENVSGSRTGDDVITGTSGANTISTYGGDDSIYALGGSDKVYAGSGDDYVRVGGGVESFYGGSGDDDYISYYDSSGGITIDLAANTITGSWGNNDVISGFESVGGSRTGDDKMYGTSGANRLKGYGGDDSFWGGSGNDKVYGGSGDDYVRVGGGVESFYGGSGSDDYISYYDSSGGITIDLAANTVTGSWANNDVISGFESVGGSRTGDDKMYGTSGANRLKGYGGDDSFWGGSGNDKVYGGSGDDYVRVGGGVESFYGGSGSDDYISYYDSSGGITIDLAANTITGSWANNDVISGFESAGGSRTGADKMYGTSGANRLKSYGGDDSLWGRSGDDKLYGGSGADRFDGGNGDDTLYGGSGDDIFHFDRGEDNDIIKDFENNDDTIQFDNFGYLTDAASALAFATETGGDVLFNFGADGTLRVENATKAQLVNDIEIV